MVNQLLSNALVILFNINCDSIENHPLELEIPISLRDFITD